MPFSLPLYSNFKWDYPGPPSIMRLKIIGPDVISDRCCSADVNYDVVRANVSNLNIVTIMVVILLGPAGKSSVNISWRACAFSDLAVKE